MGGGELLLVDGNNNIANIQMEACSLFLPPPPFPVIGTSEFPEGVFMRDYDLPSFPDCTGAIEGCGRRSRCFRLVRGCHYTFAILLVRYGCRQAHAIIIGDLMDGKHTRQDNDEMMMQQARE